MNFLKKRRNAFLIAAVIVILATLFGAYRSLGESSQEVSDTFYDGVYDSSLGYTLPSIYGQLQKRAASAMNMITIGVSYEGDEAGSDTDSLRSARNELLDAMTGGDGPAVLFDLDTRLQESADALYDTLYLQLAASSDSGATSDMADLESDYDTLNNAARVIGESGYNEHVRAFNRSVLSVFPANLLKTVTFVRTPELFE